MKWQGLIMVIPASVALWQLFQQPLSWRHGAAVGLYALIGLGIRETWQRRCKKPCTAEFILAGLTACGGALATYILAQHTPLGPVAASGIVGLCAAWLLREDDLSVLAYTGVFVGMSSPEVLPSLLHVGAAGMLAGIIYQCVHGVFDGVGGRLGTMAAAAVLITVLIAGG